MESKAFSDFDHHVGSPHGTRIGVTSSVNHTADRNVLGKYPSTEVLVHFFPIEEAVSANQLPDDVSGPWSSTIVLIQSRSNTHGLKVSFKTTDTICEPGRTQGLGRRGRQLEVKLVLLRLRTGFSSIEVRQCSVHRLENVYGPGFVGVEKWIPFAQSSHFNFQEAY